MTLPIHPNCACVLSVSRTRESKCGNSWRKCRTTNIDTATTPPRDFYQPVAASKLEVHLRGPSETGSPCCFRNRIFIGDFGGRDRVRTCDLVVANDALSQLSYTPTCNFKDFSRGGEGNQTGDGRLLRKERGTVRPRMRGRGACGGRWVPRSLDYAGRRARVWRGRRIGPLRDDNLGCGTAI